MKNIQLSNLITELKKTSIENDVKVWKSVALNLEKPTRQQRIVNLYKIDKFAKENEIVVVPGKVLGTGVLAKKLTVAAYDFSEQAKEKVKSAGAELITISELLKNNPKGSKVRILG